MPKTITRRVGRDRVDPDTTTADTTDADRAALRKALEKHREIADWLQHCEDGALRAHHSCLAAMTERDDAERALRAVEHASPAQMVDAFLASGQAPVENQRLREAQAKVDLAAKQLRHAQDLEAALQKEIAQAQGDLRFRDIDRNRAKAAVIVASPQFQQLRADIKGHGFGFEVCLRPSAKFKPPATVTCPATSKASDGYPSRSKKGLAIRSTRL